MTVTAGAVYARVWGSDWKAPGGPGQHRDRAFRSGVHAHSSRTGHADRTRKSSPWSQMTARDKRNACACSAAESIA